MLPKWPKIVICVHWPSAHYRIIAMDVYRRVPELAIRLIFTILGENSFMQNTVGNFYYLYRTLSFGKWAPFKPQKQWDE